MKALMAVAVALMLAGCIEEEKEVSNVSVRNQIQELVIAADSYTMSDSIKALRCTPPPKPSGWLRTAFRPPPLPILASLSLVPTGFLRLSGRTPGPCP